MPPRFVTFAQISPRLVAGRRAPISGVAIDLNSEPVVSAARSSRTLRARLETSGRARLNANHNWIFLPKGPDTMIAYSTLGTNDMDRSIAFYDAVFGAIDGARESTSPSWTVYGRAGERPKVALTPPYDKQAAQPGNGPMLAFETDAHEKVDAFHAAALAHGGSDEGLPGLREGTHYVAYARDPEGNKLCVFAKA